MTKKFTSEDYRFEGQRLDIFLSEQFSDFSRAKLQKLIKDGVVLVNRARVKTSYALRDGDEVFVGEIVAAPTTLVREDFDLNLLYEDKDCLVIEKPAGLVVHPGAGDAELSGTLVNRLLDKVGSDVGSEMRPGIVHRLDKDTSGLMVIAKTHKGYNDLVGQFQERKVGKSYLALVAGKFGNPDGVIEAPIGRDFKDRKKMSVVSETKGKPALSLYHVLETFETDLGVVNLVEVEIKTGRTHQIRVHMSSIGHPLLGDGVYGERRLNKHFEKQFALERQFLHAAKLKFHSPDTGDEVSFESELSEDLEAVLIKL
jgi:23S rRNA pseudouridine1911/1915/1917 synthase